MTDPRLDQRRRVHAELSAKLAALGDAALAAIATPGPDWRRGIGGWTRAADLSGHQVFVKAIRLSQLELRHEGATANLFNLPLFYQYGVGSAGFGAWRELSACLAASAWALGGECPLFPLLYHWRVLAGAAEPPTDEERARIERAVVYWGGSPAIAARLRGMLDSPAVVVLFLEHAPHTLSSWLGELVAAGPPGPEAEAAILDAFEQWQAAAAFMNARGVLHFDLHAHNVLTDGQQLYVADFGLATSSGFDLSADERAFFETHALYDRCYAAWSFVRWLNGAEPDGPWPGRVAEMMARCGPTAELMREFLFTLRDKDKLTPYPAAALAEAYAELSGPAGWATTSGLAGAPVRS